MGGMTRARVKALLKFAILTGAADSSTAGITCAAGDGTAITVSDEIVACYEMAQTSNAITDRTSTSAIIAGGKVTVPESADDRIAVWWLALDAGLQVDSPYIGSGLGAGALANTDITISGIGTSDVLISVVEINASSGLQTDRTAASTITAANTIRCTQSTNGNSVYVLYMDKSGPLAFSAMNLQFAVGTVDTSPSADPSPIAGTSSAVVTGVKAGDTLLSVLAVDETDFDALYDLTPYCVVAGTNSIAIEEPSPTATVGAKLLVFWQKANDLG